LQSTLFITDTRNDKVLLYRETDFSALGLGDFCRMVQIASAEYT
jgi:hypothetical protein